MHFVLHYSTGNKCFNYHNDKKLKILRGVEIEGIHYTATKSKETRSKILALACTKDTGKK